MGFEIIRRQTTFWEFSSHEGKVERIHFHGKEEFAFSNDEVPSFTILEVHPLLIDYKFSWEYVYLTTPTALFEQVALTLQEAIEETLGGWRSAQNYFNQVGSASILREGFGQLLCAPLPVAEICREVLHNARLGFTSLAGQPARWPRQALIAGRNYVVAKSFSIEVLS